MHALNSGHHPHDTSLGDSILSLSNAGFRDISTFMISGDSIYNTDIDYINPEDLPSSWGDLVLPDDATISPEVRDNGTTESIRPENDVVNNAGDHSHVHPFISSASPNPQSFVNPDRSVTSQVIGRQNGHNVHNHHNVHNRQLAGNDEIPLHLALHPQREAFIASQYLTYIVSLLLYKIFAHFELISHHFWSEVLVPPTIGFGISLLVLDMYVDGMRQANGLSRCQYYRKFFDALVNCTWLAMYFLNWHLISSNYIFPDGK